MNKLQYNLLQKNIFQTLRNQSVQAKVSSSKIQKNLLSGISSHANLPNEWIFTTVQRFVYLVSQPRKPWELEKKSSSQWAKTFQPLDSLSIQSHPEWERQIKKKQFYLSLDNLNYRMFGIGFPLFTLGLLSGAVWANSAWGSYWSWDIKEVGSFIQWLFVALYFHCRYKNYITFSHFISFFALLILFFNFFGISLGIFGSSLHAYV